MSMALQTRHRTGFQLGFVLAGGTAFLLALGFFLQWPLFTRLWPWPDASLSYTFIASIFAAVAAPVVWLGVTGDFGAARGGALNLGMVFFGAAAVFSGLLGQGKIPQWGPALVCMAGVAINVLLFQWTLRQPMLDPTKTPSLVRFSFLLFTLALVAAGLGLLFQKPVFPWALNPDSSVVFSFAFLGAACYFGYGFLRPCWSNAAGQLLAFLAYDLVLIVPYVLRLLGGGEDPATQNPSMYGGYSASSTPAESGGTASLIVYILVLVYSGILAIWFLFFHPSTRLWRARRGQQD